MSVSTHLKLIDLALVKTSNDCSRSVFLVELKQKLYFFSGDSQFAYVAQHSYRSGWEIYLPWIPSMLLSREPEALAVACLAWASPGFPVSCNGKGHGLVFSPARLLMLQINWRAFLFPLFSWLQGHPKILDAQRGEPLLRPGDFACISLLLLFTAAVFGMHVWLPSWSL